MLGEQPLGLFIRLGELLRSHQDVGVLDPRIAVRGVEFDAAFEQKLGLIKRPVARGDLREQAHSLDMGLVGAQEVFAQALGVGKTVLRQVADDTEQFVRQRFEKGDLVRDGGQALRVAAFMVELGETLPTVDQRRIGSNSAFESRARAGEVPHGDVVVADFLVHATNAGFALGYLGKGGERHGPLMLMTLGDGQGVLGFGVVRLFRENLAHQPRGPRRRAIAQQVLRFAYSDLRCGHSLAFSNEPQVKGAAGGRTPDPPCPVSPPRPGYSNSYEILTPMLRGRCTVTTGV